MSEILPERDYNTVAEDLAAYRRGEITKKLEQEDDPARQIQLMTQRETARQNLRGKARRTRRKR